MAIEPKKISELTQTQRNELITALGCKTIHRMNFGDDLPVGLEPDEMVLDLGILTATDSNPYIFTIPANYTVNMAVIRSLGDENSILFLSNGVNVMNNSELPINKTVVVYQIAAIQGDISIYDEYSNSFKLVMYLIKLN